MPNRFLRALNRALTALICLVNGACRSEAPKLDQLPAESALVTTALKPTANTARVDLLSGRVESDLGARIGDTENQLKLLYEKSVRTTPHKYTDGHYMTVLSETDSSSRIVFETDGVKVIRFRSGRIPEVEYVEGCG